jgi:UDP-N-acetylmuramyl tripeptide synthase
VQINLLDRVRLGIAVFAAKTITATIRTFKLGAASVLPGTIGKRLHPQILAMLSQQIRYGVIVVAGTNGKTTTSLSIFWFVIIDCLRHTLRTISVEITRSPQGEAIALALACRRHGQMLRYRQRVAYRR